MNRRFVALVLSLAVLQPAVALADTTLPSIPPDLQNNPIVQSVLNAVGGLLQTTNGNTAHGKVTYFHRFDMQVETAPNVFRDVHLHQGTAINPRGASIGSGMLVDVSGTTQADHSLNADSITIH